MRYLQTYRLYEAQDPSSPLLDAMTQTPEGRDLAALAQSYRVDRKGKMVITGLRGTTYIEPQPDGTWKHWVLATGRVYGQGTYSTLKECLTGCWLDFLLYSQSIRPAQMNMEAYQNLVSARVGELKGRALSQNKLRQAVVDMIQEAFKSPIQKPGDFFELPKWKPALEILGLAPRDHGGMELFPVNSPLANIFLTAEELNIPGIQYQIPFGINIKIQPWQVLKMQVDWSLSLELGGERSSLPAFADQVWSSKRLYKAMTPPDILDGRHGLDFSPELRQRALALRQAGVQILQQVAAGGKISDLFSTLLSIMRERDFTFAQAKNISTVMPELWQAYLAQHEDPDSMKYAPILGDFF